MERTPRRYRRTAEKERRTRNALLAHAGASDGRTLWIAFPFPERHEGYDPPIWDNAIHRWHEVRSRVGERRVQLDNGSVVELDGCEFWFVLNREGHLVDFQRLDPECLPPHLDPDHVFGKRVADIDRIALAQPHDAYPSRMSWAEAKALVEARLEQEGRGTERFALLEDLVEPTGWGWIVPWGTEAYARSRALRHMLIGAGPFIVDGITGEIISTGSMTAISTVIRQHERKRGYRAWWRVW